MYSAQKTNGTDTNELYALKVVAVDMSESAVTIQKSEEKIRNERKVMLEWTFAWNIIEINVVLFFSAQTPIPGAAAGARLPFLRSNDVRFQHRQQVLFGAG